MSELSFEQMFEESSFKRLRTGEAVTGQVIGVKEDEIILSIAGSKSEGIITRSEFTNEPGGDIPNKCLLNIPFEHIFPERNKIKDIWVFHGLHRKFTLLRR